MTLASSSAAFDLDASSAVGATAGMAEPQAVRQTDGIEVQVESSRAVGDPDAFVDGRTTPTPESESAHFLSRNPSFQSQAQAQSQSASTTTDPGASSSAQPVPERQTAPTISRAEVGFGALSGEQQLKSSLQSKDRLFLLVLAKEVEAFLTKVQSGDMPNIIPSVPLATTSTSALASMTASFVVGSKASSTFQRMLVYKLADWYGVKAVHTPEVGMLIGVIGTCDPNSASLRLADLAPRADSPPQKIKLMRRNQASGQSTNGQSRPGSTGPSATTSESDSTRSKTLEEREEAYAKARQRIYGPQSEASSVSNTSNPQPSVSGRQSQVGDDDFETAPRSSTAVRHTAGLYSSKHDSGNTRKPAGPPPAPSSASASAHGAGGPGYGQPYPQYQMPHTQQQDPMQYPQYAMPPQAQMNQYPQQNYGYPPQGQPYNPMPMPMQNGGYMQMGMGSMNAMYPTQQSQGYQNQWAQMPVSIPPQGYPHLQQQMQSGNPMPIMQQGQGQVWPGSNQVNMQPHQPMPMIPQGMQPAYGYPNQQVGGYPHLVQPTPMRPPPHPHSSASSSISSMSYHSWHDISRPHSRGSTTSNMSATSSVRFGAMYPANQQTGRYQQKGMKASGTASGSRPTAAGRKGSGSLTDSRSTRPHSPSSVGTTSSQSSRRAGSISLAPPSQHPLPQRPDWAANNIPYHPSPIVSHPNHAPGPGPSSNDFPPLRQHGLAGTQAEPMQVERTRTRTSSGNVWNGATKSLAGESASAATSPRVSISQPAPAPAPAPASPIVPTVPVAVAPVPPTPVAEPTLTVTAASVGPEGEEDPDFPRRAPSMNSSQTLYDPSAPTPSSRPESTKPVPIEVIGETTTPGMIPQDIIEAKLAEVSLREGVEIGPPPSKTYGPAPSYAKIVRRD